MVKQYKVDEVAGLVASLKENKNIVLTKYSGIKVKALSDLRKKLRQKGATFKVVKNNLFKRALTDAGYSEQIHDYLKGPVGVAFTSTDLTDVAKIFRDFKKDQENFNFSIGVMDNVVYSNQELVKIADLPTLDVLQSKILYMINAPATRVASGMNQIMASLARGIKAVAEKNAG
jgi:large subunit ribosomal protein L10